MTRLWWLDCYFHTIKELCSDTHKSWGCIQQKITNSCSWKVIDLFCNSKMTVNWQPWRWPAQTCPTFVIKSMRCPITRTISIKSSFWIRPENTSGSNNLFLWMFFRTRCVFSKLSWKMWSELFWLSFCYWLALRFTGIANPNKSNE